MISFNCLQRRVYPNSSDMNELSDMPYNTKKEIESV